MVTVTQTLVATTTTLTASATEINTGQSVTFTAKVAPQTGSTVPTGTVTFLNGTTILGTATLNASGTATFSTTTLPAGSDSITASYGGSTTNSSSVSAAVTVTVTQTLVATTTSLTASATQINTGQSVTFTAIVSPTSGSTTPDGYGHLPGRNDSPRHGDPECQRRRFLEHNLSRSGRAIDYRVLRRKHRQFQLRLRPPSSSTSLKALVATTTTLTSSATQINTGQSVTFTAKVAPQTGSTIPTGTVSFLNGTTILGTATLNAGGTATFSTTTLPAGSDPITASYGGSTTNSSSVSRGSYGHGDANPGGDDDGVDRLRDTDQHRPERDFHGDRLANLRQHDSHGYGYLPGRNDSPRHGDPECQRRRLLEHNLSRGRGSIDYRVLWRKHHQFQLRLDRRHRHGGSKLCGDHDDIDRIGNADQHRTERDLHREGCPANRQHNSHGNGCLPERNDHPGYSDPQLQRHGYV